MRGCGLISSLYKQRVIVKQAFKTHKHLQEHFTCEIAVKAAVTGGGALVHAQPEYEDCAAAARKTGCPLKVVQQRAVDAFYTKWAQKESKGTIDR